MKNRILRNLLLLCLVISTEYISAQTIKFLTPLKVIALDKVKSDIRKDSELLIQGVSYSMDEGYPSIIINAKTKEGNDVSFDSKKLDRFEFKEIDNIDKVWNKNLLTSGTIVSLLFKGYQYGLRNELNEDAVEYINNLNNYDRFYKDDFFEDYLYSLLTKIHEDVLHDHRPGNIYIKIIKDPDPNAFSLPNGCIVISTGLLSTIQSEDELVGVLAHEIAHFVLDHQVLNINKEVDRKKKAEFWSTFATVLAASADVYLAVNNKNYIPGILTASTVIGATILSEEITRRLGIKYSEEQEIEADKVAKEILGLLKYDNRGLSVALLRIKKYCISTGNHYALTGGGTHPSLDMRIGTMGLPNNFDDFNQSNYLKKVSFINSYNAWIELEYYSHHEAAFELVNRNINNSVATEMDYLICAKIMRRQSNTDKSNEDVLVLINKAKVLNINAPISLNLEEGITLLRLNRKAEAKKAFQAYLLALLEIKEKNGIKELTNFNRALEEEVVWCKKMIYKIDHL